MDNFEDMGLIEMAKVLGEMGKALQKEREDKGTEHIICNRKTHEIYNYKTKRTRYETCDCNG